jgi:hypothetical protein
VNFFFASDPHLAVGSIVEVEGTGYLWRCYTDPYAGVGSEADMKTAEQRVAELCRLAAAQADDTEVEHAA